MKTKPTAAARGARRPTTARPVRATPAAPGASGASGAKTGSLPRGKKSAAPGERTSPGPGAERSTAPRAKSSSDPGAKKRVAARARSGSSGATATDGARWRVRPEIAHREVEGQIVLLLPHADELFTLNDSARVVWRKLVAGATVAELGRELARHYGIARATAERDVQVLVRELARRRIVASVATRR